MDPSRAAALHELLGRNGPAPGPADPLPPFWHHIYFWEPVCPENTGIDGHPKTGGFLPDTGLPKRMWASGRIKEFAPLRIGRRGCKKSVVDAVEAKDGRSGPLAFVTLRHEFTQSGEVVLEERQTLVYRRKDAPAREPLPAPSDETASVSRAFDSSALFRFSALTFNGHRIHYDAEYCRAVEGYPSLVVHGPLLALMLTNLTAEFIGGFHLFDYRAIAPLFANEFADFCIRESANGADSWVRGADGRLCMSAKATTC